MRQREKKRRSSVKIFINVLFYGLLLFVVMNTGAKSWILRQLLATGFFKASIKNEAQLVKAPPPPAFSYIDADGRQQSTEALKGRVVFLNFWATWCPPCRAEMPSLNQLYQQLKHDSRFVFLFLNEDENAEAAKNYLQKEAFAFPLVRAGGIVPAAYFKGTLPTTVVLDKEGRIVLRHEGLAQYNTTKFIEQLKSLL